MNIPDDVALERFDPAALETGIPQVELPCGDPACMAEPGQRCGSLCTHGEPNPEPSHEDLVQVDWARYAVRHCPRCKGTGQDSASPDLEDCRCMVGTLREMEMRANGLYWQAEGQHGEQAQRTLAEVRRIDAEALVMELTQRGVSARVHLGSQLVYSVVIDTKFGRIFAGIDRDHGQVLVQRVDATQWALPFDGEVRIGEIAWTLRSRVPELASDGGRLDWVIAAMPMFTKDYTIQWIGCEVPTRDCPFCSDQSVACPGPREHMWEALDRLRDPSVSLVFGAFPVPADAPVRGLGSAAELFDAIWPLADLVWCGHLIIT